MPDLYLPFNVVRIVGTFYAFALCANRNDLLKKAMTKTGDEYDSRFRTKGPEEKVRGVRESSKGRRKIEAVVDAVEVE